MGKNRGIRTRMLLVAAMAVDYRLLPHLAACSSFVINFKIRSRKT